MSRISGLRNDNNKRTFYKERRINKRSIHFLSKQNLKAPLILDMYGDCTQFHKENIFKIMYIVKLSSFCYLKSSYQQQTDHFHLNTTCADAIFSLELKKIVWTLTNYI